MPVAKPFVVVSVSLNTPNWHDTDYFSSREDYCRRHGYRHLAIEDRHSEESYDPRFCAWLRIPFILRLIGRYDVAYFDHDVIIRPDCPPLDQIATSDPGFHIVNGYSGRPNSGVMFVRSDARVLGFALRHWYDTPPEGMRAPYENGHIIWGCHEVGRIQLPQKYNNTSGDEGCIIHHTGPTHAKRRLSYSELSESIAGGAMSRPEFLLHANRIIRACLHEAGLFALR